MKQFLANVVSFVFLLYFVFAIAVFSTANLLYSALAFAGLYIFWQITKRCIIKANPDIINETL